jgi:hypothetical protein
MAGVSSHHRLILLLRYCIYTHKKTIQCYLTLRTFMSISAQLINRAAHHKGIRTTAIRYSHHLHYHYVNSVQKSFIYCGYFYCHYPGTQQGDNAACIYCSNMRITCFPDYILVFRVGWYYLYSKRQCFSLSCPYHAGNQGTALDIYSFYMHKIGIIIFYSNNTFIRKVATFGGNSYSRCSNCNCRY